MSKSTEIKKLQLDIHQVTRTEAVLNQNQIQKIFNSTPSKYKYSRPARGGGNWSYVRASYIRRTLDAIFGFYWDFDVETGLGEAFDVAVKTGSCVVKGTITGRVKYGGNWLEISRTDFGRADVKFKKGTKEPLDFGNDMKAATTDCLKRCAARFGIAADVYDPGEFMEIEIIGSDENSATTKNTKQRIKEAQKVLKAQAEEVEVDNDRD